MLLSQSAMMTTKKISNTNNLASTIDPNFIMPIGAFSGFYDHMSLLPFCFHVLQGRFLHTCAPCLQTLFIILLVEVFID